MIWYTADTLDDAKRHIRTILEDFRPIIAVAFIENKEDSSISHYAVIFLQNEQEKEYYAEFPLPQLPQVIHWEMDPQLLIDLIDKFGKR